MSEAAEERVLDLLVVGAGPTGIGVGAEARKAGLDVLLVERGAIADAIRRYPTELVYFSTKERLEIAGVPFAIPEDKPSRRQALVYFREVARAHELPVALFEEVTALLPEQGAFQVETRNAAGARVRRARAVAVAVGFFDTPRQLAVPGEELPWVRHRYLEPFEHWRQEVVVVGGGSSATEAALDLFRNGARVTLVVRGEGIKPTIKYWLKPDIENRIAAGEVRALFQTRVTAFQDRPGEPRCVAVAGPAGEEFLPAQAAYVLVGYLPDPHLLAGAGVSLDPETGEPRCDPETCETDVPGLYVAGTLQAGRAISRLFIENTREHAAKIVRHLRARLGH
ncbi:MAG TPA: YpdA family putative bacillithiol disulfide reductase [Thermoanaerobaculia bacterium]|nr:YpdA family putative bacillithiol disulfide reductase [Thermoanaerobaculia bacterium]